MGNLGRSRYHSEDGSYSVDGLEVKADLIGNYCVREKVHSGTAEEGDVQLCFDIQRVQVEVDSGCTEVGHCRHFLVGEEKFCDDSLF